MNPKLKLLAIFCGLTLSMFDVALIIEVIMLPIAREDPIVWGAILCTTLALVGLILALLDPVNNKKQSETKIKAVF